MRNVRDSINHTDKYFFTTTLKPECLKDLKIPQTVPSVQLYRNLGTVQVQ